MSSIFVTIPKVTAIINQGALNRTGLVADAIFPPVKTACKFSIVDWNKAKGLKEIDDLLNCKTDVHEVDSTAYELLNYSTQGRGLSTVLTECCVGLCDDGSIADIIENSKMVELFDKLLVNHERRAVALATTTSYFTDNSTKVPGESGAVNEGGYYHIAASTALATNYNLLGYLQPIQSNNYLTGVRNVAVMTRSMLNKIQQNSSFIGASLGIAQASEASIAASLGVSKIVIADAGFNNAVAEGAVSLQGIFPENTILFVANNPLQYSEQGKPTFGLSAYTQNFMTTFFLDPRKGLGQGQVSGKLAHDLTPIVVTYKAATLVKFT